MSSEWLKDYIQLALRIDRAFSKTEVSNFIDNYYGPAILRDELQSEKVQSFAMLATAAEDLLQRLQNQNFDTGREKYLAKHLEALIAVTQMFSGKKFSFFELVERVFDIRPVWIPEEEFESSLRLMNQALPGEGDIRLRFHAWQESQRLPKSEAERIIPIMQEMLGEARKRTENIIALPQGEGVEIQPLRGVNYGAANWYKGGYQSRLEVNLDRAVRLPGLLYQMCHEGYPGHHTESCLKEQHIYRKKGWLEQSLYFTFGPQLVISEGIASLAPGIIFTTAEAAEWYREHFSGILPPESLDVDLEKLLTAFTVVSPDDLSSNLATLIEAGRKPDEILEYAMAFSTFTKDQIEDTLLWLQSQMARLYAFTYSHGKRMIEPLVKSERRFENIRTLLTEQVLPSQLEEMAVIES